MDKIPKFRHRQKPKPPAIQTSLDRSSTESAASSNGGGGVALVQNAEPSPRLARPAKPRPANLSPTSTQSSPTSLKPPKTSKFRSLSRLRNSAKRGRSASPAPPAVSPSQTPTPAGGSAASSPPRSRGGDHAGNNAHTDPGLPAFLALSAQGETAALWRLCFLADCPG